MAVSTLVHAVLHPPHPQPGGDRRLGNPSLLAAGTDPPPDTRVHGLRAAPALCRVSHRMRQRRPREDGFESQA